MYSNRKWGQTAAQEVFYRTEYLYVSTFSGKASRSAFTCKLLSDDGKIWSDRVSFTASKPIEADMLHMYNPQQTIDEKAWKYNYIILYFAVMLNYEIKEVLLWLISRSLLVYGSIVFYI